MTQNYKEGFPMKFVWTTIQVSDLDRSLAF